MKKLCNLSQYKKLKKTNYVSNKGNKYPIAEYNNHGYGGIYKNYKDLPKDGYPYTIEFEMLDGYLCCKNCTTCDKYTDNFKIIY